MSASALGLETSVTAAATVISTATANIESPTRHRSARRSPGSNRSTRWALAFSGRMNRSGMSNAPTSARNTPESSSRSMKSMRRGPSRRNCATSGSQSSTSSFSWSTSGVAPEAPPLPE
ncbi:MAG: hypothetical protein KDB24_15290, partial [Microthrixaceae bacterium]|nr:hypothetical protein [Microthrixaceae bacterium]